MAKEAVLARVEVDLERGDLGKARDRLHALVFAYPDDVAVRTRLAEVYHRLQLPAMAGRYWYLEERRTPEMEAAVTAFEGAFGRDPLLMLAALKFRGDLEQAPAYVRERLEALRWATKEKYGYLPNVFTRSRRIGSGLVGMPPEIRESYERHRAEMQEAWRRHRFREAWKRGAVPIGDRYLIQRRAALVVLVVTMLAGTGLVTVLRWLWGLLR